MNTAMIKEEEVTSKSISDLFKSAFFKVSEIDDNNRFLVDFDEMDVSVDIDDQEKLIKFWFFNKIEKKTYDEAVTIANRVNIRSVFVRFYVDSGEDITYLVAEYEMSYEMGVIPFQVVNMAKSFENIAANGARFILGYDEDDES